MKAVTYICTYIAIRSNGVHRILSTLSTFALIQGFRGGRQTYVNSLSKHSGHCTGCCSVAPTAKPGSSARSRQKSQYRLLLSSCSDSHHVSTRYVYFSFLPMVSHFVLDTPNLMLHFGLFLQASLLRKYSWLRGRILWHFQQYRSLSFGIHPCARRKIKLYDSGRSQSYRWSEKRDQLVGQSRGADMMADARGLQVRARHTRSTG